MLIFITGQYEWPEVKGHYFLFGLRVCGHCSDITVADRGCLPVLESHSVLAH